MIFYIPLRGGRLRITQRSHCAPRRSACGARSSRLSGNIRALPSFFPSCGSAQGRKNEGALRTAARTNCSLRSQLRLRMTVRRNSRPEDKKLRTTTIFFRISLLTCLLCLSCAPIVDSDGEYCKYEAGVDSFGLSLQCAPLLMSASLPRDRYPGLQEIGLLSCAIAVQKARTCDKKAPYSPYLE